MRIILRVSHAGSTMRHLSCRQSLDTRANAAAHLVDGNVCTNALDQLRCPYVQALYRRGRKFRISAPLPSPQLGLFSTTLNSTCTPTDFWCKKRPHHQEAMHRWAEALMNKVKHNAVEARITGA